MDIICFFVISELMDVYIKLESEILLSSESHIESNITVCLTLLCAMALRKNMYFVADCGYQALLKYLYSLHELCVTATATFSSVSLSLPLPLSHFPHEFSDRMSLTICKSLA